MTIVKPKTCMRESLTCLALLISSWVMGQDHVFFGGGKPKLSVEFSPGSKWKAEVEVGSMQQAWTNDNIEKTEWRYGYVRGDLQAMVFYNLSKAVKVGAGMKYRNKPEYDMQRAIQHVAFTRKLSGYKLVHRIRFEQSFPGGQAPEIRTRYRLMATVPLRGQYLDPGESFLSFSDEVVLAKQGASYDIDNRITINAGYLFNEHHEALAGLHYRLDEFLYGGTRQQLWINIGWGVKL